MLSARSSERFDFEPVRAAMAERLEHEAAELRKLGSKVTARAVKRGEEKRGRDGGARLPAENRDAAREHEAEAGELTGRVGRHPSDPQSHPRGHSAPAGRNFSSSIDSPPAETGTAALL
ncbi:MAG: hypothetical protein ACXW3E_09505, partial [Thermoanaerobaculia bacterium]